jgi:hypothetical protein
LIGSEQFFLAGKKESRYEEPYQIESQRAVKRLEEMATEGNPAVQMVLPMAEMVGWLRRGVGEFNPPGGAATDAAADGKKR